MRHLVVAMRPRQWTKNLLVVVAPLAAGRILDPAVALAVLGTFAVFSAASSAVYLLNDVLDRERDAAHPVKRSRPVASGRVTVASAVLASTALAGSALVGALLVGPVALVVTVAVYLGLSTLYSLRLKHEPLADIVLIATGFLLRAVAGGIATGTAVSAWFLVTAASGALFIAAGKRSSELANALVDGAVTRPSLVTYSAGYLRFVWTLAATLAVTATALWGLEVAVTSARPGLAQGSVVPLGLAVLRYAWWIDRGEAEAPEEVLRRDPGLLVLGTVWGLLLLGSTGALG